MMTADDGMWLTYYNDWSAFRVFKTEIKALRYAVENNMECKFLLFGEDPREVS